MRTTYTTAATPRASPARAAGGHVSLLLAGLAPGTPWLLGTVDPGP